MSKIAVFGGSFDPVHKSHVRLAEYVLKYFDPEKFIFVIAYVPPHKMEQYAKIEDRLAMLELAVANIEKTEISLYEVQKAETAYSYQTLDYFQNLYSKDEIYMVIGSDSLLDLATWKNIDYLASRYKFIVVRRPGVKIDENVKYLDRCIIIDKETDNISSRKIRALVRNGSKEAVLSLDKKVYDYIIRNGLYK